MAASSSTLSGLLQRGRQRTRSIRFKITFKIWLLLLAVFGFTNLAVNLVAARLVQQRGQIYLGDSAILLAFGLENWLNDIRDELEYEAGLPSFRSLEGRLIQPELNRLAQFYPYRQWRVWSPDGRLLAFTGQSIDLKRAQEMIVQSKHFRAARRGEISYGAVHSSSMIGEDCLAYIVPIYRTGSLPAKAGRPADGMLSFCLPLDDIKRDLNISRLTASAGSQPESLGLASQYLVGDNGVVIHLLGPHLAVQESDSSFEDAQSLNRLVDSTRVRSMRRTIWRGVELFAFSTPILDQWRLVTIVTGDDLFDSMRKSLSFLLKLHILALILITLVLYLSCGSLLKPLQFVAQALRRFRDGCFELVLPPHERDEMGVLLDDLQDTGLQLETLLQQQAKMVRRDLQIETARRIQGDFLVRSLPQAEQFALAAYSEPALDVGADWYDAMTIGDQTLLVVADVCDKGVGSALYMSVFRTLIRYGMQRALSDGEGRSDNPLSSVLNVVNDYMIGNHGGSAMFATAFVALYHASSGRLDYVLAGQEPPLLLHQHGLTELETCGPALGLFPASFITRQQQLAPGDLLLAYSDGLVDARSELEEPFGLDRVRQYLLGIDTANLSSQAILDGLVEQARQHIGAADQFDDLTVMTLLVLG